MEGFVRNSRPLPYLFLFSALLFASCNSLPGDGGTSTLSGKVFVEEYNASGILFSEYYGAEQRVYIIYGDGTTYNDETKTSFDGSFEFRFLRKGTYTVFAYSDCLTCDGGTQPVSATIEITDNHQTVTTDDLVIDKR